MVIPPPIVVPFDLKRLRGACSSCSVRELCLPAGLDRLSINTVDRLINQRRTLARGEVLFRNGAALQSLYAIQTGFMKTSVPHPDGGEQVTGFHMPGDLLGLDALGDGRHLCDAVALERSEVCEIPTHTLERLSHNIPSLQQHFHRILSREIVRDHHMMLLLANLRAHERVATFLLNLSQRYAARGYSPTQFVLCMTRADIGSYLGLTIESVSRALSQMRADKLIEVSTRRVRITRMEQLQSVAARAAE
jgi:CRP/FNR family transcriptional regulator